MQISARIGAHSFGGPAGQIAVMHRILVEERRCIQCAAAGHMLRVLLAWDARRGGAVLAVVELAGRHEVGYLQHCRCYAGRHAA